MLLARVVRRFFFFSSRICQYLRTELFCACHSQTFTSAVVLANRLSKCLADGEQPVVQNCKEITSCPAPPKTLPKGLTAATRTIVLLPHIQPCTPTHTLANFSPALYRGRPLISGCLSTSVMSRSLPNACIHQSCCRYHGSCCRDHGSCCRHHDSCCRHHGSST